MQINFYARAEDQLLFLDLVFAHTSFRVVELSSLYGKELRAFTSAEEINRAFTLEKGRNAVLLALWDPTLGETNIARKVALDPKYCGGHTFRYAASGWSIQQLYLNGSDAAGLHYSTLQGFTEKGAQANDPTGSVNPTHVSSLHWEQIRKSQKILKNLLLKTLKAEKAGSFWVLPHAAKALQAGRIKQAPCA